MSKAQPRKLGYVGSIGSVGKRNSDAWFTPAPFVESARIALGGSIDLDPFSSAEANEVVKAATFWTEDDDAFSQDWASVGATTVWMNPPYSASLVGMSVMRLIDEFERGSHDKAVILVNNATETKWFQRAAATCSALCLPSKRIAFWNADGKAVSSNTRGQTFFYFGTDPDMFRAEFAQHGVILRG